LPSPSPAFAIPQDGRDLDTPAKGFDSIASALEAIARGEPVVVLDDEDRENEGDLILSADRVTPESMAFLVEHTSGVICIGMEGRDLDRLRIPLMVPQADNEESMSTAFTVTVDLREGTTTGISAADRAATIHALASASSVPDDFKRPGHIFPLRYREGGVLVRPGHTEASVDLSRLAGCAPAGVLCEIVNRDGTMSRTPELLAFAQQHGLKCITIADLVRFRLKHEPLVERTASGVLPTRYGTFSAHIYRSILDGNEHVVLVAGDVRDENAVLTRVHSESTLGDVFGSQRCDTRSQLDASLENIAAEGRGVLIYLRGQQGRGLGLADELNEYTESDEVSCALKTSVVSFELDLRDYGIAAHIAKDLGVGSVRMLTNNISKIDCFTAYGIKVVEQVGLPKGGVDGVAAWEDHGSSRSRNGAEPHFI